MTKEQLARDAADVFRLLRAFRSIKDRTTRGRVIETVEAMAQGAATGKARDDKAEKPGA
ncbi:hypothetical protein [Bradyrhizobium sp. CCBAU 53421]|uniref:hypothetical protein n=1 Tax=Bradyrhizobium sp. CCBAU 53421 TaxID=1325120 RepID=UPI00188A6C99|nr:hypothetical protein [Bradyrhizobium sp. CCBAU 53421]